MLRNITVENLKKKWMIKHKEGFTLFELLIALFIGTILIMSGAYAIRTGLFSMEREEAWFNDTTKEKAAFDFFWQQVSSLRNQKIPRKDILLTEEDKTAIKKKTIYFSGEKEFLSFVSPLSFKKHYGQGLIIANYKVKLNDNGLWDLIYMETRVTPTILIKLSEESESILNTDKDYTIFLKDCDVISFAYLDTVEEENDNEEEVHIATQDADVIEGTDLKWKEKITERIPQAIKLSVSKNGREQELISPIMAMYSFLASGQ